MIFKTISDLDKDIVSNFNKIPKDIDLVVGVPRSGLIVASIISVYLNCPLLDIESFLEKKCGNVGNTKKCKCIKAFDEIQKVLVVEDSVNSGISILEVKEKLNVFSTHINILYMAAYVTYQSMNFVDIYYEVLEQPRVFEWNYMHNPSLEKACVDIDGVLCEDPSSKENDDGDNYIKFLKYATPKFIPSQKIGWIVTSRLEKYRKETEEWLSDQGIEYNQLVMMECETAEERRFWGNHGIFKGEIFAKQTNATWFIESDPMQAKIIADISKKLVFCVGNQEVYGREGKVNIKQNRIANIKAKIKGVLPKEVLVLAVKMKKIVRKYLLDAIKKN